MKDNKHIKAVFFDAADTLFYINGGLGNVYSSVASKYGSNPDPNLIDSAFSNAFRSAPPLVFGGVSSEDRKVYEKKWWYRVVQNVFDEVGMFDEFDSYFEELFEVFRNTAWKLFPETQEVLSSLENNGFKIGLISNFDTRVYDVCQALGIYDYFRSFVISSEAGFAKPSPQIFEIALNEQGVLAEESILIGDSIEHDILGAKSIGMNSALLDREENYNHRADLITIRDLTQVLNLLGIV
ncbi:MAG: HAD-IA family hydrolase [Deltaproteobacteria bacterium]|nr:HAD-IA family hydrolase [Deltaproteobacteria bacterium]